MSVISSSIDGCLDAEDCSGSMSHDQVIWKQSQFNILTPSCFDGWMIAFNAFTGVVLFLPTKDFGELLDAVSALCRGGGDGLNSWARKAIDGGFVVRVDRDERDEVRKRYWTARKQAHGLSLTLAPTVNCNFGCSYCYQSHSKRRMDESDVDRLLAFVDNHLPFGTGLYVTWFGGEPLTAIPVLKRLIPELQRVAQNRSAGFRQSMITNAYQLTADVADWFASLGNFDYLQVTLDGPPEIHNARRPLANGRPTFHRVLENVRYAADKVPVTIRVNVDNRNVDRLDELLDELVSAGLRGRVGVYLGHTAPYTDVCASVAPHSMTRQEYAAVEARFRLVLLQRGWLGRVGLPRPSFGGLCIADNQNGYVVAPEGLVFKCWNEVAESRDKSSAIIGSGGVLSPLTGIGEAWEQFDPFFHEPCRTCRVQPLCRGGCPWESRKNSTDQPGHCSTLRYNIEDVLRLHHLDQTLMATLSDVTAEPGGTR